MTKGMKNSITKILLSALLVIAVLFFQWYNQPPHAVSVADVPPYSGDLYVIIDQNTPNFTNEDLVTDAYEFYSELDALGRCGYAMACLGQELMPTEKRGEIGHVKPSGWIQAQYDFVEGKSLYNRSHLIGFQLAGENDNKRNLITATRTCNAYGMLPFENMVADYIKETGNHVIYRVTPIYEGNNLVASGVQMEAMSVEDQAQGICFHVYVYNVEPGVEIDYATGESRLAS
jgi:DNA-entry nuclease